MTFKKNDSIHTVELNLKFSESYNSIAIHCYLILFVKCMEHLFHQNKRSTKYTDIRDFI